jgi:hypothetical protein
VTLTLPFEAPKTPMDAPLFVSVPPLMIDRLAGLLIPTLSDLASAALPEMTASLGMSILAVPLAALGRPLVQLPGVIQSFETAPVHSVVCPCAPALAIISPAMLAERRSFLLALGEPMRSGGFPSSGEDEYRNLRMEDEPSGYVVTEGTIFNFG